MPLGKYKGMLLTDVLDNYKQWLLMQGDIDPTLLKTLENWEFMQVQAYGVSPYPPRICIRNNHLLSAGHFFTHFLGRNKSYKKSS